MLLFERFISIYAPFCCLGCGAEQDRLLCANCEQALPRAVSQCYICHAATRDFAVCQSCQKRSPLRHVYVAVPYDGLVKEILHAAKYERAKSGLDEIAAFMAPLLDAVLPGSVLVHVPTATSRVRQRGYDQAEVLSRRLAKAQGLPHIAALARIGQAHQVGAGRAERLRHLDNAFRVRYASKVKGAHLILVDDVLTTGATLETAARALKKAGAAQVDAVVFARAN